MPQSPFKVLIVGCGNIAGGYDMDVGNVELPCSHAGTYSRNEKFKMVACVEPNDEKRSRFMEYWNISEGFRTLEEVLSSNIAVDVVSICSPTEFHFDHVMLAIKLAPRLIFCEKPVTGSSRQTKSLINACDEADILLAVNYTRRWDPEVGKLKQQMSGGHYGELRSITGYYNKGILNNGSHMIDLLHYLLGDLQVITTLGSVIDYSSDDLTIPVLFQSEKGVPVYLTIGNAQDYSLFELQIICSKGLFSMCEGGLYWNHRKVIGETRFAGYQELDTGNIFPGGYQQAMTQAIDNVYEALTNDARIASDGANAYQVQLICEKIMGMRGRGV